MSGTRYDTIVIGSGAGGLTAALVAARAGQRVLVLEAGKQFGGYLNPFARRRFHFDTGLHYIGEGYDGSTLRRIFDELGVDITLNELTPEGFDWYVFPEYDVKLGRGFDRFHERLRADFPHEGAGIDRFFALLRRFSVAFDRTEDVAGVFSALRHVRHVARILRWHRATLAELLDHHFTDQVLKNAICGPCGDLGLPPSRLSAVYHLAVLCHYLRGGYYPHGGSGGLRDAYVQALRASGAELRRNSPVRTIVHDGRQVSGVITADGEFHGAQVVISNAEAVQTYRMASLDRTRRMRQRLARVEPSCASFMVFLGIAGDLDDSRIGDANIWHYGSNDIEAIYRRIARGELPSSELMFITAPTLKDPLGNKAPPGHHTVEIVALASPEPFKHWFGKRTLKRGAAYAALKAEIAEPLIETAERYIPRLRERIVIKEIATPATNRHYVGATRGSIYGPAHTPRQVLMGRFGPSTPVGGLLLCGSSVICAGVYPCIKSGYTAGQLARQALARDRVRAPVAAPAQLAPHPADAGS